jgi:PAS domain S-box-containing protein
MSMGWFDLFDRLGGGVFRADPLTLRVTFVSQGLVTLSGYPAERWLGDPPLLPELLHPEERATVLAELRAAAEGSERVLVHCLRAADGTTLFFRTAIGWEVAEDGTGELLVLLEDISRERHEGERRLESDARLQSLVENLPFDFWACDTDARCVLQNAPSKNTWGDVIGRRAEDFEVLRPEERAKWAENIKQALSGSVVRDETTFQRGDKASTYINIITPIRASSEIRGVLGVGIDVTELREAERELNRLYRREKRARAIAQIVERRNEQLAEELQRSLEELKRTQAALVQREKLAALGELASVIAHEVRNPLGVIFNSLGALRKKVTLEGEALLLFDILDEEAQRLNRIVVDLLDWVRPIQPMRHAAPLAPIVDNALKAAERAQREPTAVEISSEVDPSIPNVLVDEQLLHLALVNIFSNALQAMPKGGRLKVGVRKEAPEGQDWATIEVQDTGQGIPSEMLGRIFEPFFTTKASGTGLGLAVVKRIVESLGGDIEVQSTQGRGTTFTIRLHIATEMSSLPPPPELPPPSGPDSGMFGL